MALLLGANVSVAGPADLVGRVGRHVRSLKPAQPWQRSLALADLPLLAMLRPSPAARLRSCVRRS
jgi:hypothetical protein